MPSEQITKPLLVVAFFENIGNLHRLAGRRCTPHGAFAKPNGVGLERLNELIFHPEADAQVELLGAFVILVDRASVGGRELNRMRHDPGEHRFKI